MRGLAWKVGSQAVSQGSRSIVAIILAHLLAPHDYGVAGMVMVFASFVFVFSDLALGAALVQRPSLTEADRSTVFWTGAAAGLLFTLVGIAVSGLIANFYDEPEVGPLFAALSVSFFVTALATTHSALLNREMNFRALEIVVMVSTVVGAVIGVIVALKGYGPWALIAQQLASSVVWTLLLWKFSPWRPRFIYSRASIRDLGGFSGNVFAHRTLYYLHRNSAPLLIGKFVGAAALGAYTLAFNIIFVPFSRIAGPIQEVLFPAFSRIQNDKERMATLWIRALRLVATISIPALLGMVAVAPDFVEVVLGPKWSAATPIIQILGWVGLLQSLQTLSTDILQALDQTSTVVKFTMVFFTTHLAAFIIGLHWGVKGVAIGYAISTTLVEPIYARITARALGISVWTLARSLSGVAQASLIMFGGVLAARSVLVNDGTPSSVRLLVLVFTGFAIFGMAVMWRAPEVIDDLKEVVRTRRGRAVTA